LTADLAEYDSFIAGIVSTVSGGVAFPADWKPEFVFDERLYRRLEGNKQSRAYMDSIRELVSLARRVNGEA